MTNNNIEAIAEDLGISIINTDGTYKDTYTILQELQSLWRMDDKCVRSTKVGEALKTISKRLSKTRHSPNTKDQEFSHTCGNCKFHVRQQGYDYERGMLYCTRSWCEKGLMHPNDSYKTNYDVRESHYIKPCDEFECGEGRYIEMGKKEKRELGLEF